MQIEEMRVADLIPYENNPRKNDEAVEAVAASIKEFGFKVPIIVDADNVIIAGHTRLKAAQLLGMESVPVIRADDLTDEQVKAFRLADNKTAELAGWDFTALEDELAALDNIDMTKFGFEKIVDEQQDTEENPYTQKTDIPHYDVVGFMVGIPDLVDTKKADEIIKEIDEADITIEQKNFLRLAAQRLNVFNYKMIAEYYAQTDENVQRLMEKLALVIIDIDNAIANGYVKLSKRIDALIGNDA